MKVCKPQVGESITSVFQASSLMKMGLVSATMWPICLWQFESLVTLAIGDSSSRNVKAELLHNGNMYPSFSWLIRYRLNSSFQIMLDAVKYDEYCCQRIHNGGVPDGFSRRFCHDSVLFLPLWQPRNCRILRQWIDFNVGWNNVKWKPLLDNRDVLFPSLHLNLRKQFITDLDKESGAFKYIQDFFPKLSEAKVKASVFVGSLIKR